MKKETQKQDRAIIKTILIIMVIIACTLLVIVTINQLQETKKNMEICKSLGYDGVKFVSKYNNEVECSNFSPLEKARRDRG